METPDAATDSKLSGYYKKTESDAKYSAAGSGYGKAESDAKYAAAPKIQRGVFNILATANAADEVIGSEISFGVTLAVVPAEVSGSWALGVGAIAPAFSAGAVGAAGSSAEAQPQ